MNTLQKTVYFPVIILAGALVYAQASAVEEKPAASETRAKAIDTSAQAASNHPDIPEGVSCNDCHEVKYDANTTATQVWLTGDTPGKKAGEGVMPKEKIWQEFTSMIGAKTKTKTFILATCLNNEPLSTTAEFSLDPKNRVLYGLHEMGTEKLNHVKNNPKVSLNWHKDFDSFADFRCCQIKGHAVLIDNTNPEFATAVKDFLPYEKSVRLPPDATDTQKQNAYKARRDMLKKGNFVVMKIAIDRITMANSAFAREGFRVYQRWVP
ncbi:MAG: pyridoxamine 5'-phosphate oxidase family protein [Deltaproteobacteria bacterium]|nr:pyridoxamine 5'-phosphate oxidase family protein [Deltaproteobacteria bacterium]